mgnify:CR=1 FL=1
MAFYFGDNTDILIATLFEEQAIGCGADITSMHPEEMDMRLLSKALVVSRMAYKEAINRRLSAEVLKGIMDYHDYVFVMYCENDPGFVKRMRRGNHRYLGKMSQANQRKYWKLAGIIPDDSAS